LKKGILTWILLILSAFWIDQSIIPSVFSTNSIIRVPEDYPTIQEAVNAAKPGDTVLVSSGTYYESIFIDKPISLIGEDKEKTIIKGDGFPPWEIVQISSTGVRVSGFTIGNPDVDEPLRPGILLDNSTNCIISENIVINCFFGIWLRSFSSNNTIENNILRMNYVGIVLQDSFGNLIMNNTSISNERFGLSLMSSNDNILANNTLNFNREDGIALFNSNNNKLVNNTLILNGREGIKVENSAHNKIVNNVLSENVRGIEIAGGDSIGNKIIQNNIQGNIKLGIDSHVNVDATLNWWGDPTGPYHPIENPHGLGDPVGFKPWDCLIYFKPWSRTPIAETPVLLKITFSNLSINPRIITPGELISISADVRNTGEEKETYNVELLIRGEVIANTSVVLLPGELKRVTFTASKEIPGIYRVAIGSLTGVFKVIEYTIPNEPKKIIVPINYPSIQEAIDAANAGDTIFVQTGIYHENLFINKSISLIGEDRENTFIIGARADDVILVTSDHVIISNFTITSRYANTDSAGIRLKWSDNSIISDNILTYNAYGIYLYSSSHNIIENNNAYSNIHAGIFLYLSCDYNIIRNNNCSTNGKFVEEEGRPSPFGSGIYVWVRNNFNMIMNNTSNFNLQYGIKLHVLSNNNTVVKNTFLNNSAGIFIMLSDGNILANNTSNFNSGTGIFLHMMSNNNMIVNNTNNFNKGGIVFEFVDNNHISKNMCLNNGGPGISIWGSRDNTIINNKCNLNEVGISLENSFHNEIYYNNILMNWRGIVIAGENSNGNEIHQNNIAKNVEWGLLNDAPKEVNATLNWWGSPYGPQVCQFVEETDSEDPEEIRGNVLYRPWLTAPIGRVIGPTLRVSNLSINPAKSKIGGTISISINATNVSDLPGTFTITLKVNDAVEEMKNVTLSAGESSIVTFELTRGTVGTYTVEVDGLTGSFTVEEAPPSWELYIAIVLIAIAIGVIIVIYRGRRLVE